MNKKISFLMRYDYLYKSGGDVVQITNYCVELEKKGYACEVVGGEGWHEAIKDSDIVFLVNVDRPIETIFYFERIKRSYPGKRVYLIPIHHPIDAITNFEKKRKGVGYSFFSFLFSDFYVREKVKNLFRFRKNRNMFLVSIKHIFYNYRIKLSNLISSVDGVLFISSGEKDSLLADFKRDIKNYEIAYNAVSFNGNVNLGFRNFDFVVVGRIEPRKNQDSILGALSNKGYSIALVGPLNQNSKEFSERVIRLIDGDPKIKYFGSLDHTSVLSVLNDSKVLINASYFEVNPLVDLEAALCGCKVVTTKYSYSKESLPDCVEIDPWDKKDIFLKSVDVLNSNRKIDVSLINVDWQNAADKIICLISKYV